MHQSTVRSPRPLAARGCHRSDCQRRSLPLLRRVSPQCSAPAGPPTHPAQVSHDSTAPSAPPLTQRLRSHGSAIQCGPLCRGLPWVCLICSAGRARQVPTGKFSPNSKRPAPIFRNLANVEFFLYFPTESVAPAEIRKDFTALTVTLGGEYDGWGEVES